MRNLHFIILATIATLFCSTAMAQFSITTTESDLQGSVVIDTLTNVGNINNTYFNKAEWKAEKLRIRKERTTLEFEATLQTSKTGFDNWESGGSNTFNGRSTISAKHVYKKEIMTSTTTLSARYGMNVIDGITFKNEDEFQFNWQLTWTMKDDWSYAGSVNFRSQFTNGYESIDDNTLVSSFMAPGYLDIALGFNFNPEESPFDISLSPLTGSIVLVLNDSLSMNGTGGVTPGEKTKGQLGPSINISFDKKFGKNEFLRYRSNLYTFTNFNSDPTVRWENTLDFSPVDFITMTFYLLAYYDKAAVTPRPESVQYQYSLSLGLSYKFSNKE